MLKDDVQSILGTVGDDRRRWAELDDVSPSHVEISQPRFGKFELGRLKSVDPRIELVDLATDLVEKREQRVETGDRTERARTGGIGDLPHCPVADVVAARNGADVDELPAGRVRNEANHAVEIPHVDHPSLP